jgi:GNAT superfamily N-acetyltransferase
MNFHHLHERFDAELLERFHAEVLTPSFRADELEPAESLARGLRSSADAPVLATVALGPEGEPVGGLVGELYPDERVLLIAYLAARPGLRRQGIGSGLMREVAPLWYADERVSLAVAEVHDPRVWFGVDGDDAAGRLRLYDRLGARTFGIPFVQPAVEHGGDRVRGFLLLAFHAEEAVLVREDGTFGIPSDLLVRWTRRYFETAEGVRPPYDPELGTLIEAIESRDPVPLLPLSRYELVPLG